MAKREIHLGLVIEREVHQKISQIARLKEMSLGALCRMILKSWLKLNENKPKS